MIKYIIMFKNEGEHAAYSDKDWRINSLTI